MITFSKIEDPVPEFTFTVPLKSIVVLRISLKSNFVAPAVIQPKMGHWISTDGTILPVSYKVMPLYIYLSPHAPTVVTMSIDVPAAVKNNDEIYSPISFSGIKNCTIGLRLRAEDGDSANRLCEQSISIDIPYHDKSQSNNGLPATEQNFIKSEHAGKILVGLAGLDMIPSRYLVAELVLNLCDRGHDLADMPEKQAFVNNLLRTQFFKNGTMIIAASQLIHWVLVSLSISSGLQAVTGNKAKYAGMLHSWEEWLLNLAGLDIEAVEHEPGNGVVKEEVGFESIIAKTGVEPEKWFLYLVLGVMELSPRLHVLLEQICAHAPETIKNVNKKRKAAKKVLREKGSLQR